MSAITQGITNFWNTLTGQAQEDARTDSTNQSNLQAVQDTNQANRDIAKETNATNFQIAQENLGYQRELQEYNKALQQQIFEREDTSYERTARDMRNAGLNPLSMQGTNGAGEAIAQTPLNNNFQAQNGAPMQAAQFQKAQTMNAPIQALSHLSNLTSLANSVLTGTLDRDRIRLQNQAQQLSNQRANLENFVYAEKNHIKMPRKDYNDDFDYKIYNNINRKRFDGEDEMNSLPYEQGMYDFLSQQDDERDFKHNEQIGRYDSDSDVEKVLTSVLDWAVNGRGEEYTNKLVEKYPFLKLFIKPKK